MSPTVQIIKSYNDVPNIVDNTVHLQSSDDSQFRDSSIEFHGTGNVLYVEDGAKLRNCRLRFMGDNAVIHIRKSARFITVVASNFHESVIYLGPGASFTTAGRFVTSEREHIIMGSDAMFSSRIAVRTADPHLVYSTKTHQRINPSRSVWVGDHVWLGEDSLLLKGARIGSGAILGARALVTGTVPSNASVGGTPARVIGQDLFWTRPSVHGFTQQRTDNSQVHASDEFIFTSDGATLDIDGLESSLALATTGLERAEWCHALDAAADKNRFFLPHRD